MPVDNSKKILVLSNLLKGTPEADEAIYIGLMDKRLEKNSEINLEALEGFVKKIVEEAAPNKRPLEMNVILLDPEEISALNEKHLFKSGPTDVLAFPIDEPDNETDDPVYLMGDVCICPAVAAHQAREKGLNFEDEIALLLTHGILHLLGYDHYEESAEVEMKKMEKSLIDRHIKHLRVNDA
ncbi:MAG: rRNA maturation RNase YbeY [Acidimicrobiales bacterium]|jgi:probable rRNA maturation factor|nr:rRNA maturation RNase YbeY [Acidimicrobiales bacterium]